jgi:hypothetical protein
LLRLTAVKAPDSHHPRINTSLTSIEIDGTWTCFVIWLEHLNMFMYTEEVYGGYQLFSNRVQALIWLTN